MNDIKKKIAAVIPARMGASRFPGKPLAKILDLPMIEHVRRRVQLCQGIDEVYVATCDQEIFDVVTQHGGRAIMTADTHERCTDRVDEAANQIEADMIVIFQGDEPLFQSDIVDRLIEPMIRDEMVLCTNLLSTITDKDDLNNTDIVKALLTHKGSVMFYSRAAIPYQRSEGYLPVYRQTGLSVFRKDFLRIFSNLEPTPLEKIESVDFLRMLEWGYSICGVVYDYEMIGVDKPEHVEQVENILKNDENQKKIYQEILNV